MILICIITDLKDREVKDVRWGVDGRWRQLSLWLKLKGNLEDAQFEISKPPEGDPF